MKGQLARLYMQRLLFQTMTGQLARLYMSRLLRPDRILKNEMSTGKVIHVATVKTIINNERSTSTGKVIYVATSETIIKQWNVNWQGDTRHNYWDQIKY